MPIKPIDLQALFMQLNQVSREQFAAKDGVALQQSIQGALLVKKREDEAKAVKRPQAEEDAGRIRDRESEAPAGGGSEEKKSPEDTPKDEEPEVVKDPNLGHRVDISG
jgi:hypothetical protein